MTLLLDVASAVGDGDGDTMRLTLDFLDHCVDPDIPLRLCSASAMFGLRRPVFLQDVCCTSSTMADPTTQMSCFSGHRGLVRFFLEVWKGNRPTAKIRGKKR